MFYGIDSILGFIPWYSFKSECGNIKECFVGYYQSHKTMLWIWIIYEHLFQKN